MYLCRSGAYFLGDLKPLHSAKMNKLAKKFGIQDISVSIAKASPVSPDESAMQIMYTTNEFRDYLT